MQKNLFFLVFCSLNSNFAPMKRIGLLSDTHSHWDERYEHYFSECDEVWHAGDFGNIEIADKLREIKHGDNNIILRGVHGNIDGDIVRREFPEVLRFKCEEVEVLMKHIGGYPGRYDRSIYWQLTHKPPQLFISGHSHILKVMYDRLYGFLHVNPGAAGLYGQQPVRTLVRFTIDGKDIKDLVIIELA